MNKKLYIGNLPFSADENTLKAHFGSDGRQVLSAKIMMDRETGRSRGFAFVEMATPEDAQRAVAELHNKEFLGRPLTVNEAREQPPRVGGFGGGGPRPGGFGGGSGGGGLPRPNGPGGPAPASGGFNRGGPPGGGFSGPRPGGGGGGFGGPRPGGGFPPPSGFEPPQEPERGRANRDRGKDKDRDRRKRGGNDDDWG